jgi:putative FmdB family regulatory protein
MPTYEYACTECGAHIEVVQSMSDAPLTACAVCGGKLRKVFSPIGIVFKGSGFYRTDSRGKPAKAAGDKGDKGDKGEKQAATAPANSENAPSKSKSKSKAEEKSA